ncbi:hypothetical protein ACJX0J_032810, partial [Zea mays]
MNHLIDLFKDKAYASSNIDASHIVGDDASEASNVTLSFLGEAQEEKDTPSSTLLFMFMLDNQISDQLEKDTKILCYIILKRSVELFFVFFRWAGPDLTGIQPGGPGRFSLWLYFTRQTRKSETGKKTRVKEGGGGGGREILYDFHICGSENIYMS